MIRMNINSPPFGRVPDPSLGACLGRVWLCLGRAWLCPGRGRLLRTLHGRLLRIHRDHRETQGLSCSTRSTKASLG